MAAGARYTRGFSMNIQKLAVLPLLFASLFAAETPRKSPEFAIHLTDGKQVLASEYRGKVLCLVFILTT